MVKKENEDKGIVWDTRIRVEEFINILKKPWVRNYPNIWDFLKKLYPTA